MSIMSRCIGLGGEKDACFKLYPFRGRGAPSFSMAPTGRVCCYFKYKTNKGMFGFIVRCRGCAFKRTLGRLTSETKIRLPGVRCSKRTGGGTRHQTTLLRVGGLTTKCFCCRLHHRDNERTRRCLANEKLDRRAVEGFNLKCSSGCDSSLCGCLGSGGCDSRLLQSSNLFGISRHEKVCSGF